MSLLFVSGLGSRGGGGGRQARGEREGGKGARLFCSFYLIVGELNAGGDSERYSRFGIMRTRGRGKVEWGDDAGKDRNMIDRVAYRLGT